jgi:anti-sigma B factor antagonist
VVTQPLLIESIAGASDDQRILQLRGPLVLNTVIEFQTSIRAQTATRLILDLTAVQYIDSAGLGALVSAYIATHKNARRLALVGLNNRVKALLDMSHVAHLFEIYTTLAEAQQALF